LLVCSKELTPKKKNNPQIICWFVQKGLTLSRDNFQKHQRNNAKHRSFSGFGCGMSVDGKCQDPHAQMIGGSWAQDFHVIGLASELAGWNESFLDRPSAKSGGAKAKAKANGDQGEGQTDIGLALSAAATSTFWCCGSCAASNACHSEGP